MDRAEAAAWLGVAVDAPADVVRSAFRRLVVQHHPDRTGATDTAEVRRCTDAYRILRASETAPAPAPDRDVASTTDDTITFTVPPDEAFERLLDAAATVGDVTYVDPEAGLLEVVVTFDDGRRTSAVVSLQGRAATGATDAFITLEALDERPAPAVAVVVAALAHALG